MKKIREVTNRIAAMLLSGMLAVGSVPGTVLAADFQIDPGQTSEVAAEQLEEIPFEEASVEESVDEGTSSEEAPVEDNGQSEAPREDNAVTSYTVTLDANGGYFENEWDDVLNETLVKTETVTKLIPVGGTVADFPVYVDQDGQSKVFAGWSLERDGELVAQEGEEFVALDNCVLYAVWRVEDEEGIDEKVDAQDNEEDVVDIGITVDKNFEIATPESEDDYSEDDPSNNLQSEEYSLTDNNDDVNAEGSSGEDADIDFTQNTDVEEQDGNQGAEYSQEDGDTEDSFRESADIGLTQDLDGELLDNNDEFHNIQEDVNTEKLLGESTENSSIQEVDSKWKNGAETSDSTQEKAVQDNSVTDTDIDMHLVSADEPEIESVETNASASIVHSGSCGENLTWELDDQGILTIYGTGRMEDFGYNNESGWSEYPYTIKKVIIQEGVTSIGNNAFKDCSSLTSTTIPSSVTSIGDYAFSYCTNLTDVTIPSYVTSIGYCAFSSCGNLTSVTIPSSMISIGNRAFEDCTNLTSVIIPSSVTSIGDYVFEDCSNLTSVTIPSSVTSIGINAFAYCKSLTNVTIPSSVTSIGNSAFRECSSLTSIRIPSSVTSIEFCSFYECSNLTRATIMSGVTSIGDYAFSSCSSLTSVTIPSSVTSIGKSAFKDCDNLTRATIMSGVTSIGDYAFSSCSNLTSITIPSSVTSLGNGAFSICSSLTSVTIPSSVTSIGGYVFQACRNLTSVTIPSSVTSIGDGSFDSCSSLISVTIPSSVTSIGHSAFVGCSSLTSVTIPSSVTSIGHDAFRVCSSLTSVTIPSSVTEIKKYTFFACNSLTSLTIPSSVTSIGDYAIASCNSLSSLTIPSSVTYIGNEAFKYLGDLHSIYFKGDKPGGYYFISYLPENTVIYYPYNNDTWSSTIAQYNTYTWLPWDPDSGIDILNQNNSSITDSGTCGDSLTWAVIEDRDLYLQHTQPDKLIRQIGLYSQDEGDEAKGLLIGGTGEMYDYDSAEDVPWYEYDISYVVWAGRPVSIGNHAFDGIDLGDKAEPIPDSVERIGAYAFAGRGRRDIVLPASVRSIESHAFGGYKYKTGSGGSLELNTNVSLYFQGSMPESLTSDCLAGSEGTIYFLYDNETWREIYYNPTSYQFGAAGSLGGGSDTVINYKPFSGDINNLQIDGKKGHVFGTISSVNASDHSVTIDGKTWYFAPDCDQISVAQKILDGQYSSKKVICGTDYDYIKIITPLENAVRRTITIDSGDPIRYENGAYSVDSRKCKLNIAYQIVGTKYYSMEDFPSIINDSFTLKNLRIEPDKDAEEKALVQEFTHFTGNIWDSDPGTITFSDDLTVGYGEKKTLYFTIHPLLSPENVNSILTLNAQGEDEDGNIIEGSGTIRFHNVDLQRKQAAEKKQEKPSTASISNTKSALKVNNVVNISSFPNLMGVLTTDQQSAVEQTVKLWITQIIMAQSASNNNAYWTDKIESAVNKKILDKAFSYLGVDVNSVFGVTSLKGKTQISIDSKYGPCTLDFKLDIGSYAWDSNPFGAFGTLTCTVNGLSSSQIGTSRSIDSPVTFANCSALADRMRQMVKANINNLYPEGWWAQDMDQVAGIVADSLVHYPVSALLEEYHVSLSHGVFKIAISAQDTIGKYRKIGVHCPVDVYVYDDEGALCGAIVNNEVDLSHDEVCMYVNGDDKYIVLMDDNYYLKYVGTDKGTMSVDVSYYDGSDDEIRDLRFDDIPLEEELEYRSSVPDTAALDQCAYLIREIGKEGEVTGDTLEIIPVYDSAQEQPVEALGIIIDQTEVSCTPGKKISLKADVVPAEAEDRTVTWSSNKQSIVEVDTDGNITAKSPGTAIIYAVSNSGGFKTECEVTVMKAAQSITASNLSLTYLKTGTIKASGNKGKLSFKSSNTAVATVDSGGKVTAKGTGTAKITITAAETSNYKSATKTITVTVTKAAQSITAKAKASSVALGKTTTVSITGAKGKKSYKSSNTAIATVTSSGIVTAKKIGTVKITATSVATANYKAASKTITIKVVPIATASLTAANQATGIKLTWKRVTGANGYKVYRGSTLIKTITSGSTLTFADAKANTNGTKYTYKVVAKASTGDSTLSKSVAVYRVARPAVSSVINSASKKMTVKWGKNAKANGYQIQYSTDKTFKSGTKSVGIASASTVSRVIGSLTKGKTYYVRIRTYKTVGSAKYWSMWSVAKSVKISK